MSGFGLNDDRGEYGLNDGSTYGEAPVVVPFARLAETLAEPDRRLDRLDQGPDHVDDGEAA